MNGVEFEDLRWLNLLWAVLALALVGGYGVWQRHRTLRLFASAKLLTQLVAPLGWTRPLVRLGLVLVCLTSLVVATIGPRWGEIEQSVVHRGIDVMVLLDVSRSMLARDIAPNRLERAKLSLRDDLLPSLGGDRVGLITFAGLATVKCPLTNDYGFMRLVLEDVSTESSPRGGTLIGDAIRKAGKAFDDSLDSHKIVILITDGEDQESFPYEAAQALWEEQKIPVVTVALGDERQGARIPIRTARGEQFVEHDGQVVWSRADFGMLRRVAGVSDLNAFVPVGTRNFDLGQIYRERIVPAIEFRQRREGESIPMPSQYHVFALLALGALLVDSFLRDGPRLASTVISVSNKRREAA